jgi:hypothetical protein
MLLAQTPFLSEKAAKINKAKRQKNKQLIIPINLAHGLTILFFILNFVLFFKRTLKL